MDEEKTLQQKVTGINAEVRTGASADLCPKCGMPVPADAAACPADGTQLTQVLAPGIVIMGRYQLQSLLGSGGMGSVYQAKQLVLDKLYAIKFLTVSRFDERAAQRFAREAKAVSRLHHPNIVQVYDVGTTERGCLFMIMDLVEGNTLAEKLNKATRLPVPRALNIFTQICDAMSHAHEQGILHRDLKPSNIMLTISDEGREHVKILDFGIAKVLQDSDGTQLRLTTTGEVMGSPVYMSPEQGAGDVVDARSDIYSLGCLMFETLSGTPPLQGQTLVSTMMMHQNTKPPTLKEATMGEDFPPPVEAIMQRCLAKQPAERFQSMAELKMHLENVLAGRRSAGLQPAAEAAKEEKVVVNKFLVSTIVCALVAITLAFQLVMALKKLESKESRDLPTVIGPKVHKYDDPIFAVDKSKEADEFWAPKIRRGNHMKELKLEGAEVGHNVWTLLQNLTDVEHLILSSSTFSDEDAPFLSNIRIKSVELEQTNISGATLKEVAKIKGLIALSLEDDPAIKDADLKELAVCPQLRNLDLSATGIVGPGLAELEPCKTLVDIDVTMCKNIPPANFAYLQKLPQLTRLIVSGTSFNDKSAHDIVPLQSLEWLEIRNTSLDDEALEYIAQLPNLRLLNISQTNVTAKGLAKLLKLKNLHAVDVLHCPKLDAREALMLQKKLPVLRIF